MVYVSRSTRILRYLRHAPRHLFNKYPEQFVGYSTFGVAAFFMCIYKIYKSEGANYKPYYRGRYDVVRPDDPRALNRRAPEEYPPPYLSRHQDETYFQYFKDLVWTAKN